MEVGIGRQDQVAPKRRLAGRVQKEDKTDKEIIGAANNIFQVVNQSIKLSREGK